MDNKQTAHAKTSSKCLKMWNSGIKTNSKDVEFLDITFNLSNGLYKPYKKPNDPLLYINKSSIHTTQIFNQLP